jgi:hypothetical protein
MNCAIPAVVLIGVASSILAAENPAQKSPVERGKYLATTMGCHDCHTPKKMGPNGPEPDFSRTLIGHPENTKLPAPPKLDGSWVTAGNSDFTAWVGPWGISYASNLTPDENTGLGIWTEEMFLKAMKTGRHMGTSRPILPPMPWPNVGAATDADQKALFAYLKSLPPVKNRVPDPVIAPAPAK